MNKEIILMKVYEEDRNFLERLKRKLGKKSFADTVRIMVKEFKRNKLHLDLIKSTGGIKK